MDWSQTPESFRGLLLRGRGRTGLIQRDLALRAGVSRRSVQDWEAGVTLPTAERLQALIRALLEAGGLTSGGELIDARELWAAVEREGLRVVAPFDGEWFVSLLATQPSSEAESSGTAASNPPTPERSTGSVERAQDWGEAPDTTGFVGRAEELALLHRWVLDERSRLVAVLGMGGIGKTTLTARLAEAVAPSFERVYWRSLRNAAPVNEWLAGAIGFLSDQQVVPPTSESELIAALLQLLRARRCLLVLDNSETLFEPGQREVRYRADTGGYARVLQAIGETSHRSCLLLTSREAPPEVALLGAGVHELELHGLGISDAQTVLADKQLTGDAQAWAALVERYGGNGLALKIVGDTIRQVFEADITAFLGYAVAAYGTVFGGIRRLLDVQVERLSAAERDVLERLAVEREPVTLAELARDMAPRVRRTTVVEAIETLRRRSLVERGDQGATFTLQSMVLEYVTNRLVETVTEEIERGRPLVLSEQPLIKAQAKQYVRQTQERLLGAPILQQLIAKYGEAEAAQRLLALLDGCRGRPPAEQGHAPGNLVNLLRLVRGDLRGLDLSRLAIRQAYLAQVDAQDARLVDAHLAETVLAEAFDFPNSVALSSDGVLLAAGTSTGQVWLWRVVDRTPLWMVQGHIGAVRGLALSARGRLLASGGGEGTVRLWDADTGRPLATLPGDTGNGSVYSLALSADGRLLASGAADGTVRLWSLVDVLDRRDAMFGLADEASSGRLLANLQGHTGAVYSVALSADGHLLASGGFDGTVRLWSLAGVLNRQEPMLGLQTEASSERLLASLHGHDGVVRAVALSADGYLVASGGTDGAVRLWSVAHVRECHEVMSGLQAEAEALESVATVQGHTGGVLGVALSADGRLVASCGGEGTVQLWDTTTRQPVAIPRSHKGTVRGVALSADGRIVASGGFDGTIKLWEATTGRPLATLQGHTRAVYSVAVSADGQVGVSGGFDASVHIWDASTGQSLATLSVHKSAVRAVAMSGNGRLVASGDADGTIHLWSLAGVVDRYGATPDASDSAALLATLQGHHGGVWGVALSADGRLLATGGGDGTVRLWESDTGRPLATLPGYTGTIHSLALSADSRLLASGGGDGTVRLWRTDTGMLLATLQGHTGGVLGVALSADGRLLASGGGEGSVRLWSIPDVPGQQANIVGIQEGIDTGQLLATLRGHIGAVMGVALSADGTLVATVSAEGTLRLWKTETGQLVSTMHGHTGIVRSVALSADGHLVASGGWDGTVRLWEASSGTSMHVLQPERRYERMNITGLTGVTAAQRAALLALGAIEHDRPAGDATARMSPVP